MASGDKLRHFPWYHAICIRVNEVSNNHPKSFSIFHFIRYHFETFVTGRFIASLKTLIKVSEGISKLMINFTKKKTTPLRVGLVCRQVRSDSKFHSYQYPPYDQATETSVSTASWQTKSWGFSSFRYVIDLHAEPWDDGRERRVATLMTSHLDKDHDN